MPLTALSFLISAPHTSLASAAWLLPLLASIVLDMRSPPERRQPAEPIQTGVGDALLYVLFSVQLINVLLAARMVGENGVARVDTLIGLAVVGTTSGYSGIVVAHELMHRSAPHQRVMARILMATVLYEHFFTEHLRGHHARVATAGDPATARFGESIYGFLLRTIPAQLRSAWDIESGRHRLAGGGPRGRGWLGHRVAQGLAGEGALAIGFLIAFGAGALAFHVAQSIWAIVLLECVNYFEHWGLERSEARVRTVDSWDSDSWFTLFTLVGLSRHADHHAHAARPYRQLRYVQESPKLPYGYFGMVPLVLFRNRRFRERMTEELRQRQLGPFTPEWRAGAAARSPGPDGSR
jgi:alkane 1-monooxygenase